MKLSEVISAHGTSAFKKKLVTYLEEHAGSLPTKEFCENVGYAADVRVDDVEEIDEGENIICVTFSVSFTENANTTCAVIVIPYPHHFTCKMQINKVLENYALQAFAPPAQLLP